MAAERQTYTFRFSPAYRLAALPFGVTPASACVVVTDRHLGIRFGPWRLVTPLDNVADAEEVTGPYAFLKTAGPAHLSLADRGITFATNRDGGVCIRFRTPVPAIDPLHLIRHPTATVTVTHPKLLAVRLSPPSG
ncbi:hypothetical protein Arub01_43170 [Actinomadura rubrobrunea]|uniref:Uncharacterized protein n=1 Tax=Actinomadura rubrobrunea TaxID=115335 RepID=A0A9W6Q012_9ACTN|nr:hypothetical protein [Actinomadura rubrobrunea]GLW66073.1 hypothetical protein Arub01_43170 [Actinomadura rubrobrunea]